MFVLFGANLDPCHFLFVLGHFLAHFCRLKILSTLGGWLDEIVVCSVVWYRYIDICKSCWKILQLVLGVDVMDPPTQYSQRYSMSKFLSHF